MMNILLQPDKLLCRNYRTPKCLHFLLCRLVHRHRWKRRWQGAGLFLFSSLSFYRYVNYPAPPELIDLNSINLWLFTLFFDEQIFYTVRNAAVHAHVNMCLHLLLSGPSGSNLGSRQMVSDSHELGNFINLFFVIHIHIYTPRCAFWILLALNTITSRISCL